MRHLNEIVRERNQYSRDAMEAWQDFINLKTRMDGELSKVTKRNNFLVDELESWKQQFLKFQAFAEQLTKETQELKVKIENHKREHRRLTTLIDQQKDDAAKVSVKLTGAEKQRDDALEALVLQQEIAEELERERKRNKKELSALQHTNATLMRQRDESQRVVFHLRSLIDGQTHHMEHIIRSLNHASETNPITGEVSEETSEEVERSPSSAEGDIPNLKRSSRRDSGRPGSRSSLRNAVEKGTSEGESSSRFFSPIMGSRSTSRLSMADVADRRLRDKTDAIANIIRSISEQCAAAVEGIQLAHDAEANEQDGQIDPALLDNTHKHKDSVGSSQGNDAHDADNSDADSGVGDSPGHLTPSGERDRRIYLDDSLVVRGLGRKDGELVNFLDLSQGAREQLLLCLRLAIAEELMAGGSGPQSLILDDVLVNTDAARQERMLTLLCDAASKGLQILVCTCHPDRYRGVGQVVELQRMKPAPGSP